MTAHLNIDVKKRIQRNEQKRRKCFFNRNQKRDKKKTTKK
jgi:macrodomain Ter protein organizer (MatP/YcbG family)